MAVLRSNRIKEYMNEKINMRESFVSLKLLILRVQLKLVRWFERATQAATPPSPAGAASLAVKMAEIFAGGPPWLRLRRAADNEHHGRAKFRTTFQAC